MTLQGMKFTTTTCKTSQISIAGGKCPTLEGIVRKGGCTYTTDMGAVYVYSFKILIRRNIGGR